MLASAIVRHSCRRFNSRTSLGVVLMRGMDWVLVGVILFIVFIVIGKGMQ